MKRTKAVLRNIGIMFIVCAVFMGNLAFASSDNTVTYETAKVGDILAFADYTNGGELYNMARVGGVSGMNVVERNGRKGLLADHTDRNKLYWFLDIADEYMCDIPDGVPIDVEVEYFDEGNGGFGLSYSSHAYAVGSTGTGGDIATSTTEDFYLTDTNEWKTTTFHLENMRMNNGDSGWDLRLGIWTPSMGRSPESVVFGSITLKLGECTRPLAFDGSSSAHVGNIFGVDDEICVDIAYRNKTDRRVKAEIKAEIRTETERELKETLIFESTFEPKEEKSFSVKPNITENGVYRLYLTTTEKYDDSENVYGDTDITEFSRVMKVAEDDRSSDYGSCGGFNRTVPGVSDRQLAELGGTWERTELAWAEVEKQKDKLEIPEYIFDALKEKTACGTNILVGLNHGNTVYGDMPTTRYTPRTDEDIAAYARFCGFAAEQLKGYVKYYGILNEYNVQNFNERNDPPETYAKIVKAAYAAIKKADPEAKVVVFEAAHIDISFIERAYAAGIGDYADVVAVHPYDWTGGFRVSDLYEDIEALKEVMKKYNSDLPIWITEFGYFTYVPGEYGVDMIDGVWAGVTPEGQAAYLTAARGATKAYDLADVFFLYTWNEFASPETKNQDAFGIVHYWLNKNSAHGAKPAYAALSAANNYIGKNAEVKNSVQSGDTYAMHFYNGKLGKDVVMCYSQGDKAVKSFKLGCESVDVYDMYGNYKRTFKSDNGIFDFVMTDIPEYVIGNFSEFSFAEESPNAVIPESFSEEVIAGESVTFNFTNMSGENLTIVPEETEGICVLKNDGFINSQASLVLKTEEGLSGEKSIGITVRDENGNERYFANHNITFVEPIGVEVKAQKANENSQAHWQAVITVENRSSELSYSGKVEILAPENVAAVSKARSFYALEPGEKFTAVVNLPTRIIKRTVNLKTKVTLNNGYTDETETLLDFATAAYAKKPPVIDGTISDGEWLGSWIGADEAKDIVAIKDWRGSDDLSFSGMLMWDEENLYLMATVRDDAFSTEYVGGPGNMWQGDGIQFGIDDREIYNIVSLNVFNEIGLAKVPNMGDIVWCFNSFYTNSAGAELKDSKLAVERYDGYTVYECSIPWDSIYYDDYKVFEGQKMKFSLLVNDNDTGERRGWIEYNSGIGASKNIELFGSLELIK